MVRVEEGFNYIESDIIIIYQLSETDFITKNILYHGNDALPKKLSVFPRPCGVEYPNKTERSGVYKIDQKFSNKQTKISGKFP